LPKVVVLLTATHLYILDSPLYVYSTIEQIKLQKHITKSMYSDGLFNFYLFNYLIFGPN